MKPAITAGPSLHQLTTPRPAAVAGILFAFLFGATIILILLKMPEGVGDSAEWMDSHGSGVLTATKLMPFAGITFLWSLGSIRIGDCYAWGNPSRPQLAPPTASAPSLWAWSDPLGLLPFDEADDRDTGGQPQGNR